MHGSHVEWRRYRRPFGHDLLDDLADTNYAELIRVPYLLFSLTSKPITFITLDSNLISG